MGRVLNQAWEDVADDVTGAIEKAVQPLLKKATDDIYAGLLDTTQDYLRDNLAFNIASRINTAEREAVSARQQCKEMAEALRALVGGKCPECKGWGEIAYCGELVRCKCDGKYRHIPSEQALENARSILARIGEA